MKVLTKGDATRTWPRKWTVPCCRSMIEFSPDDIKLDRSPSESGHYIDCPACGGQPVVSDTVAAEGRRWKEQYGDQDGYS